MPSEFDDYAREFAAPAFMDHFAERKRGAVDRGAVTYVAPGPQGRRYPLAVVLGAIEVREQEETEGDNFAPYLVKRRTLRAIVLRGDGPGELPIEPQVAAVLELPTGDAQNPTEAWAVDEVTRSDAVSAEVRLVFAQTIKKGRLGTL